MTSQYRALVPKDRIIQSLNDREQRTQQLLSNDNSSQVKINAQDFLGLDVSSDSEHSEPEESSPKHKSSFVQNKMYSSTAKAMPPKPSVHSQMRRVSESIMMSAAQQSTSKQLSPQIKAKASQRLDNTQLEYLKNYCTQDLRNLVLSDIREQLAQFTQAVHSQQAQTYANVASPKSVTNEFLQYEAELAQNRLGEKKRLGSLLRFTSLGLTWFCNAMRFEVIDTKHLPAIVEKSINDGEYDDVLGTCGKYIHGTVLENPLFACGLKFIENIGQAHQKSMQEKLASYENKQYLNEDFVNISTLKSFRKGASVTEAKHGVFDDILNKSAPNNNFVKTNLPEQKSAKKDNQALNRQSEKNVQSSADSKQPEMNDKSTDSEQPEINDQSVNIEHQKQSNDSEQPQQQKNDVVNLTSAFGKIDKIVTI